MPELRDIRAEEGVLATLAHLLSYARQQDRQEAAGLLLDLYGMLAGSSLRPESPS